MNEIITKNKRLFLSGIIFSLLIAIGGGVFLYLREGKQKISEFSMNPAWEMAIDEVVKVWEQGPDLKDSHFLSQCPQYKDHSLKTEITHCDVNLFSCYFKERVAKIKLKNEWIPYKVIMASHQKQREDLHIQVKVSDGRAIPLRLENSCHQIKLPQGYYKTRFYKKSSKLKDNLWHTSGIEYSIDKFLVRNSEVIRWAQEKKKSQLLKSLEKSNPFSISSDLTAQQMEDFCRDHSSQVLTAKVHDALTFHHGRQSLDEIENTPPSVNSAPHPFGPRQDDGPQFSQGFSKSGCSKIYSKTCADQKVERSFPESIGWSGVAELLGGEMEYVINEYLPRRNLVASSYYFPYKSSWHRAGEFAYWDGKGHGSMNFNFLGERPILDPAKKMTFAVGFRCMKKVYRGAGQ